MSQIFEYVATCLFGLEKQLGEEIEAVRAEYEEKAAERTEDRIK